MVIFSIFFIIVKVYYLFCKLKKLKELNFKKNIKIYYILFTKLLLILTYINSLKI